jgi:hypothetical protein
VAADAQFAIEIAASLGGGEQTIQELDALSAQLMGAGKDASFFQEAIVQVSGELKTAQADLASANAALSAGSAEFAGLEQRAVKAAKAVEKLGVSGDTMSRDYLEAARASAQADAAVGDYAVTLRELEKNASAAAGKEEKLTQTLRNVDKISAHVNQSAKDQVEKLDGIADGFQIVGGSAGRAGDSAFTAGKRFAKMASELGLSNAASIVAIAGFAALAVAIVAIGVALVGATIKVAAWAVGLADANRNTDLLLQAQEAMHPELIGLRDTFAEVSKETGMHADELQSLAGQLKEAGVSAADMADAIEATALSEAALGKAGAADFVAEIKAGKRAVSDLSREAKKKLGPIVAKEMMGLSAQSQRAQDNIDKLFGGLNIEPVLRGLQTLVDLLDESGVAGSTIKALFTDVFQPLIDQAENAAYVVEAFALGFLIGLTKVQIAVKPVLRTIEQLFGFDDGTLTDVLSSAKDVGEAFAYVVVGLAAVFGTLVAVIGTVIGVFAALFVGFEKLASLAISTGAAVGQAFVGAINSAIAFLESIPGRASELGANIMQGLANGITGAAGSVVAAITGAVSGAINAAKSLLGIHSPSAVFADIGANTGAGMAMGVDSAAPDAQAAINTMVAPPVSPFAAVASPAGDSGGGALPPNAATAAATGGGSSGPTITITGPISFSGVPDAPTGVRQFAEMLTRALEGQALATGAGAEGA